MHWRYSSLAPSHWYILKLHDLAWTHWKISWNISLELDSRLTPRMLPCTVPIDFFSTRHQVWRGSDFCRDRGALLAACRGGRCRRAAVAGRRSIGRQSGSSKQRQSPCWTRAPRGRVTGHTTAGRYITTQHWHFFCFTLICSACWGSPLSAFPLPTSTSTLAAFTGFSSWPLVCGIAFSGAFSVLLIIICSISSSRLRSGSEMRNWVREMVECDRMYSAFCANSPSAWNGLSRLSVLKQQQRSITHTIKTRQGEVTYWSTSEKIYGLGHEGAAVLLPGFAISWAKPGNKTAAPLWPDLYAVPNASSKDLYIDSLVH